MQQFISYFWGTIVRPRATLDALAAERTVRWAIAAACLPVLQVWGNITLHGIFGFDWLGTKPLLADPTFVALFGQLRIGVADWVPVFAALMPLLALLGLVIVPGLAQMMSKLWRGQGTFEQMVNTLTFATIVPNMTIAATTEWLFGVPIDLLTGHKYWWVAAMQGEFGTAIAAIWKFWVIGVYITFAWVWVVALGSIAIRRIQKIPMWAAGLTMTIAFAISMFIQSIFVR